METLFISAQDLAILGTNLLLISTDKNTDKFYKWVNSNLVPYARNSLMDC